MPAVRPLPRPLGAGVFLRGAIGEGAARAGLNPVATVQPRGALRIGDAEKIRAEPVAGILARVRVYDRAA